MIKKFWDVLGGRKFLALLIATWLLLIDKISGEIWLTALIIYAASNLVAKYLISKKVE